MRSPRRMLRLPASLQRVNPRLFLAASASAALIAAAAGSEAANAQQYPSASDGQSLGTQSLSTQSMFLAVWGNQAGQEWVTEHNAQLASMPRPPAPAPAPPPPAPAPPAPPVTPAGSSNAASIPAGCPGASGAAVPTPMVATSGATPTVIASSNCPLPVSSDVHVTILSPQSSTQLLNNGSGTYVLAGVAYDDRAPVGQSGISQVQVYLNGLAGNNGTTYLGTATLGGAGGTSVPSGTLPSGGGSFDEFSMTVNPSILPGTSNPTLPWPTGGNVLYVYAFGLNGAVTAVPAPVQVMGLVVD